MKVFFLLFAFLFLSQPAYLEGTYYEKDRGMVGTNWRFWRDGTFTYSALNCEGGELGKGNYTITGDSIHLNFLPYPQSKKTSVLEKEKMSRDVKGWELQLQLKDEATNEDVFFAEVLVMDSAGHLLQRTSADIDGKAHVLLPEYEGPVTLRVMFSGYADAVEWLIEPGSYLLKVKMAPYFGPTYIAGGIKWNFKILKSGKKSITWQTTYGSAQENVVSKLVKQ